MEQPVMKMTSQSVGLRTTSPVVRRRSKSEAAGFETDRGRVPFEDGLVERGGPSRRSVWACASAAWRHKGTSVLRRRLRRRRRRWRVGRWMSRAVFQWLIWYPRCAGGVSWVRLPGHGRSLISQKKVRSKVWAGQPAEGSGWSKVLGCESDARQNPTER